LALDKRPAPEAQLQTHFARLPCEEQTARRLASTLSDLLPDDPAIAAFESDKGGWTVEVTFGAAPDESELRALIEQEAGPDAAAELQFGTIDQRDWVAASLEGLPMVRAGRFIVHGAHHRALLPGNAICIEIEAALAFGTGHHGTTRGCLLAIDRIAKTRKVRSVLDVGTGTGVLAIAAARVFHTGVCAADIDPVAVRVARANAQHNRAGALVTMRVADAQRALPWHGPFDLILANILLGPLTRMARTLAQRLAPSGYIVLSGLMPGQANAARAAYAAQGLVLEHRETLENWVTLTMRRGRVAASMRRP
jgi:ribosomal protein L11 methyltransferase